MTPQVVPFLFDRFECREYLGGGMTDVYRAWDTRLHREVALKLLREDACREEDARERFVREAQLACRCHHENIIVTFDAGEWQGRPYLVMELLHAQPLNNVIESSGPMSAARVLQIAWDLAGALEYVHEIGIIHRDIKPANVCLNADGKVKLIDFGVAKTADWNRTSADVAVGTLIYMAPEQLAGKPVSPAMDMYAYGAMLYELVTGTKLIRAATTEEAITKIFLGNHDLSAVPPALRPLIAGCVEKEPQNRWADFRAVRQLLVPLMDAGMAATKAAVALPGFDATIPMNVPAATVPMPASQPVPAPAVDGAALPTPPPGSRKPLLIAGAVAALLVVALVGWFALRSGSRAAGAGKGAAAPPPVQTVADPVAGDMVLVPAGDALLGSTKHPVPVAAFYIDRTEVTVRAYRLFCDRTGAARPEGLDAMNPGLPVVNVTFEGAQAFARWAKKRLLTAGEWEKAARGARGQLLPWGDAPLAAAANIPLSPKQSSTLEAADSRLSGASPYGALNMLGNAWEWVDTRREPEGPEFAQFQRNFSGLRPPLTRTEPFYMIRGGSFSFPAPLDAWSSLVTDSGTMPARIALPDIGFRCARSVL
jgi:eukaryotic-like serine/threonine-protein kinase